MFDILVWIVIGGLAGWLASRLVRGGGMGIILNVVVGIVGAFIGGFIVQLFGGVGFTGLNLWSFVVAFLGAVLLLLIVRIATGSRRRAM
jgi:uncharacterized membrane protein YeaQ/YmgE (transglycosylase-associated protein family)